MATLIPGAGIPSPSLGVDGDYYLNVTSRELYGPKSAGAWGSGASMIGVKVTELAAIADFADADVEMIVDVSVNISKKSTLIQRWTDYFLPKINTLLTGLVVGRDIVNEGDGTVTINKYTSSEYRPSLGTTPVVNLSPDLSVNHIALLDIGVNWTSLTVNYPAGTPKDGATVVLFVSNKSGVANINILGLSLGPGSFSAGYWTFRYYADVSVQAWLPSGISVANPATLANLSALLVNAVTDGDITHAPTGNAVFDAIAAAVGGSLTGPPTQVIYFDAAGNPISDAGFLRSNGTGAEKILQVNSGIGSSGASSAATVNHQSFSLIVDSNVDASSQISSGPEAIHLGVRKPSTSETTTLIISPISVSLVHTIGENVRGFFGNAQNAGWTNYVIDGTPYTFNLPKGPYLAGGAMTDVLGDGNITWVVPGAGVVTTDTVANDSLFLNGAGTQTDVNNVSKGIIYQKGSVPTVTDDAAAGHIVGSLIVNTANALIYRASDVTPGAAVWQVYLGNAIRYNVDGTIFIVSGEDDNLSIVYFQATRLLIFAANPLYQGLVYSDDFSANFVPGSLVDKQYVDNRVLSGTYAPTFSNLVNLSIVTLTRIRYTKIGSVVTITGNVNVNLMAAGVASSFEMDIPIPSNFAAEPNAAGVLTTDTYASGYIDALVGTSLLKFHFLVGIMSAKINFSVSYDILP